jgi:glycosyltransferase involved in cell wall biosynthesis
MSYNFRTVMGQSSYRSWKKWDIGDYLVGKFLSEAEDNFGNPSYKVEVIEAGFYKKALIASNIGPYTIDLTHCLKNGNFVDGNALLVDENRNHSDWAKYIEKLVKNPNLITDMGERLYETVKDTYDLNKVTKDRAEWYRSLVK